MIHLIRTKATPQQIEEMMEEEIMFIKVAVDVRRGVLAGGSKLHSDCEDVLLADGSQQQDIWGASWSLDSQSITFESMINIRPRQNNFGMIITNPMTCDRIAEIMQNLLGEI